MQYMILVLLLSYIYYIMPRGKKEETYILDNNESIDLTRKELRFCHNIVYHCNNIKEAYLNAFKCEDSTARGEAYRLYKKSYIRQIIDDMQLIQYRSHKNKKEQHLAILDKFITTKTIDLYDENGKKKTNILDINPDILDVLLIKQRNKSGNSNLGYSCEDVNEVIKDPKLTLQALKQHAEMVGYNKFTEEDIDDEDDIINEELKLLDK